MQYPVLFPLGGNEEDVQGMSWGYEEDVKYELRTPFDFKWATVEDRLLSQKYKILRVCLALFNIQHSPPVRPP